MRLSTSLGGGQYVVEYRGSAHTFRVVRNVTDGADYASWTTAWDWAIFGYNGRPDDCAGVPGAP